MRRNTKGKKKKKSINQSINPDNQGNQPCTKYFHISTKPIRLHRMLPSSDLPCIPCLFTTTPKKRERKKKMKTNANTDPVLFQRRDGDQRYQGTIVQPQTEACTPRVLFEPQTPLPFPHPSPTLAEGSLEEALAA